LKYNQIVCAFLELKQHHPSNINLLTAKKYATDENK